MCFNPFTNCFIFTLARFSNVLRHLFTAYGTLRNETKRNGILRNGILRNGILRNGILRNGILRNGILRNGTLRNGILRNGILRNSILRNGSEIQFDWEMRRFHLRGQPFNV